MKENNPINSLFKLEFSDLYQLSGLQKIDEYFLEFLSEENQELQRKYLQARSHPQRLNKKEQSELLIEVGRVLEDFLALFFNIQNANQNLQKQHFNLANLYIAKRLFVQRRVAKNKSLAISGERLAIDKFLDFSELEIANQIAAYLQDEERFKSELEELEKYCAWALFSEDGIEKHKNGVLFRLPKKLDFENLVELENIDGVKKAPQNHLQNRDGFKLTDKGCNLDFALDQTNYCIYCHNQGKDSCSTGLKEKDSSIALAIDEGSPQSGAQLRCGVNNNIFKTDPFKTELSGCPLDEKISEMNLLKSEGKSIAALAMAAVDNPMIAGTGHRICNDCMKSCIYQKQEPVNIPQIETRTLKDVLSLPFGFEIYSLLTRWNPLNLANPLPKKPSGYKILVAGLGPAGYTLAHYLLNEGHLVVAVDGLKIEPLDPKISGIDLGGNRQQFKPIENIKEIYEELDERQIGGFGGVAEYGITVRWDKNFLKIIRLLLERREYFRMFGGFRLGSGLDCYDAFKEYQFDHIALCLGAGWAKIPEIKNNFLKGIRMASDFLMALQLTGAEKPELPSNLQVRLPIVVVGAGLTAMDTACEALAYYPKQVENFANHYQILCKKLGKEEVEKSWDEEDKLIAKEFLEHHQLIKLAKQKGENITKLLQKLGGAKIIYRKSLQDSPAYRLNHEEVSKAFEEGIEFIENATPIEAIDDGFGQIKMLKILVNNSEIEIPAKALFLAAGTTPNKAPFYEDKLKFELDGGTFKIFSLRDMFPLFRGDELLRKQSEGGALNNSTKADGILFRGDELLRKQSEGGALNNSTKADGIGFICAKNDEGKTVSFFGDLHPSFNGSVVKAMASAKNGYPLINQALDLITPPLRGSQTAESRLVGGQSYQDFLTKINQEFAVKIKEVNILSDYFIELVVYAPNLARKTKLGHIFRLHNYHFLAKTKNETLQAMEGVAVTTYKVDPQAGTITVMIVNAGSSSSIAKNLKPNEPIIFMGPSGVPTHNFKDQNVVLIAGGRGIFPLASLGAEYKKQGCKVWLFCGFNKKEDLVRKEELENSCDELILDFSGDVVAKVVDYFQDKKDKIAKKIDAVLTMGNEEMMHKVAQIYHHNLKENLSESAVGITSLNNPMQCMLKGVCSQCLQKRTDKNGNVKYFYACLGQDQKLSEIDFGFLKNRCRQNSLPEKLTRKWLGNLLKC